MIGFFHQQLIDLVINCFSSSILQPLIALLALDSLTEICTYRA